MPNPFAPAIVLDLDVQQRLQALTRAHSTPQALVFRCRLILRLAAKDQPSNLQVANELGCCRNTVILWRARFLQHGLAGLQDAPRSGRPRSFSPPTNNWKSSRWPPAKPVSMIVSPVNGASTISRPSWSIGMLTMRCIAPPFGVS